MNQDVLDFCNYLCFCLSLDGEATMCCLCEHQSVIFEASVPSVTVWRECLCSYIYFSSFIFMGSVVFDY